MPKVFLSHNSKDKPFVRRLGNELRAFGAETWLDEVEIKVGDSLIEKISEGIESGDFLLVTLSENSVASEWVRKEVNIAIAKGICGQRIKVLPCILDDCTIPTFLADLKYADFRISANYRTARDEVMTSIGLSVPKEQQEFVTRFIAYDLADLNDGFDAPDVHYYSEKDFSKFLERAQIYDYRIFGIEPWPNKVFYNVKTYEEFGLAPDDPEWYQEAFRRFKEEGVTDYFSLTGYCPPDIVERFLD